MTTPIGIGTDSTIQGQIARLQQQLAGMPGIGISGASQRNQLETQLQRLQAQQAQGQPPDPNSPAGQMAANKAGYMDLAHQNINNYANDPTNALVQQYLQQQMSGNVLDPNARPFANGAPQYGASQVGYQGYSPTSASAAGYSPTGAGAASYDPAMMTGQTIGGGTPYDATTINAMMSNATNGAAAGESAANQMLRDALLSAGGNSSDPSLMAAEQENLTNRNNQISQARLGIDMQANLANFNANRQADLANQGALQQAQMSNQNASNQAGQYNASNRQQAGQFNANTANQAGQFNAGNQQQVNLANQNAANQAGQFNAGNTFQAGLANQSANNQASQFNIGNQMGAQQANYNAGVNSALQNNAIHTGAANNLSQISNQHLGNLSNANNYLGQIFMNQGIQVPGAQPQPMAVGGFMSGGVAPSMQLPSFGDYQQSQGQSNPLTGSVWAGSGRPSVGSGMTTSSFGPQWTGSTNPFLGATQDSTAPIVQQPSLGSMNPSHDTGGQAPSYLQTHALPADDSGMNQWSAYGGGSTLGARATKGAPPTTMQAPNFRKVF